MDNQHRQITGYREPTQPEIDAMNKIKAKAAEVGALVEELQLTTGLDQRWVALGKTQLQQGFMALTRGVAQPTSF